MSWYYCAHNCSSCHRSRCNSICLSHLIYFWFSFQLFCCSRQYSLEVKIIPIAASSLPKSRRGCISTPGSVVASRTDWQTADVQPTTTGGNVPRRASFSALASANSFVYFCIERSNITLTHLHVGNCRVRQLQFSGIFVALGFVGNGVITVMINSPWQADDDADNQSGDNRGDSASYINLSWPFRPLLWILQSGCQPYARTDHNQRPAVKPRYCCSGRLPDGYHHDQSWVSIRSLICCNATASWLFGEKSFRPSCLR